MRFIAIPAAFLFAATIAQSNDLLTQAQDLYKLRDYTTQGITQVQRALDLYSQSLEIETDVASQLVIMNEMATAYYFLGSALEANADKKVAHEQAMALADEIMARLGVDAKKAHQLTQAQISGLMTSLAPAQQHLLAESFYSKGISLAQWGNLNGISSSIGRLPEVIGLMERIEMMNMSYIHEFGPYRTIGRINFALPSLFGGDLAKSEEFLTQAYRQTLAEGQRYSINGYNNLYLAETLHRRGKENQAKRLLEVFLQADLSTLVEGNEPENKASLRDAQLLLDSWK